MRLTAEQLGDFISVLEKVENRGESAPRYPGRLGSYLRQRVGARRDLRKSLADLGLRVRADGAVSGAPLGAVELTALAPARNLVTSEVWGPASCLPVLSEELGGVLDLTLWHAGQSANDIHEVFRHSGTGGSVRLDGDYRWTPPIRLTAGEATPTSAHDPVSWPQARCLKATADDLSRRPHALEYAPDFQLGPPGLKCFRTVCASTSTGSPRVLPGWASEGEQALSLTGPAQLRTEDEDLAIFLVYREPWSDEWTIVDSRPVSDEQALAHTIEWLDFRNELQGLPELQRGELDVIRDRLRNAGLNPRLPRELQLNRRLLEPVRQVIAAFRGFNRHHQI